MTLHPEPWPVGTPAWADLLVADLDAACEFYRALLGWDLEPEQRPGGATYVRASLGGEQVAGLGDVGGDDDPPPSAWTVYLATDDLDATVAMALDAGADVLVPATRVGDAGGFAVLADPTGAVFGLWHAGSHTGATVLAEPGAMTWAETLTTDDAAAQAFYVTVLGWTCTDIGVPGFSYATVEVAGRTVGGVGRLTDDMGVGDAPLWLVYFAVVDTDDAVRAVHAHGGTVVREPWDSPFGRMALVRGPAGELFALQADLAAVTEEGQAPGAPA